MKAIADTSSSTTPTLPSWYKCCNCSATNCKLWLWPHDGKEDLRCCTCACRDTGVKIRDMQENGRHFDKHEGMTQRIGKYAPAWLKEGDELYEYEEPLLPERIQQWESLPNKPISGKKQKTKK